MELSTKITRSMGRFWRTNVKSMNSKSSCKIEKSWSNNFIEMRIPKSYNPRILNQLLMRFGVYDKVFPFEVTPSRSVPDHIKKPGYALNKPIYRPGRIEIKDVDQCNGMKQSCKIASRVLHSVECIIKPGITTDNIDEFIHNVTIKLGAYPSPLLYKGFPKSVCTSVNNVAAHGIPDLRPLQDGDIINVDVTVFFEGFHGDCSKTYLVGNVDDKGKQLVRITEECLDIGVNTCGPGVPFCEIGRQIYRYAKRNRLTVLPAFLGHGIGNYFHGPPDIYHTLNRYPGLMKPGMTFTIEPVLSHGSEDTYVLDDKWTMVTTDGARSAQAEHTVLITEDGVEILTK